MKVHREQHRSSPEAYPQKVVYDAVECAFFCLLTEPATSFLAHTRCFRRHQKHCSDGPNADELYAELLLFVEDHMTTSGRCAQFNSVLVRSGKSCNSLSLNRGSNFVHTCHTNHTLAPCTSSHTYRIDSAIINYRPASGNVQVLHNFLCLCVLFAHLQKH